MSDAKMGTNVAECGRKETYLYVRSTAAETWAGIPGATRDRNTFSFEAFEGLGESLKKIASVCGWGRREKTREGLREKSKAVKNVHFALRDCNGSQSHWSGPTKSRLKELPLCSYNTIKSVKLGHCRLLHQPRVEARIQLKEGSAMSRELNKRIEANKGMRPLTIARCFHASIIVTGHGFQLPRQNTRLGCLSPIPGLLLRGSPQLLAGAVLPLLQRCRLPLNLVNVCQQ